MQLSQSVFLRETLNILYQTFRIHVNKKIRFVLKIEILLLFKFVVVVSISRQRFFKHFFTRWPYLCIGLSVLFAGKGSEDECVLLSHEVTMKYKTRSKT